MRVKADRDVCEGHGVCSRLAPEVFEVGDDDRVRLKIEEVPEALRSRVELAVRRCPKQALAIVPRAGA